MAMVCLYSVLSTGSVCDICSCHYRRPLTVTCTSRGLTDFPTFNAESDQWLLDNAEYLDLRGNAIDVIDDSVWVRFKSLIYVALKSEEVPCTETLIPDSITHDKAVCEVGYIIYILSLTLLYSS